MAAWHYLLDKSSLCVHVRNKNVTTTTGPALHGQPRQVPLVLEHQQPDGGRVRLVVIGRMRRQNLSAVIRRLGSQQGSKLWGDWQRVGCLQVNNLKSSSIFLKVVGKQVSPQVGFYFWNKSKGPLFTPPSTTILTKFWPVASQHRQQETLNGCDHCTVSLRSPNRRLPAHSVMWENWKDVVQMSTKTSKVNFGILIK